MNAHIHCVSDPASVYPPCFPPNGTFAAASLPEEPTFRRLRKGYVEAIQKVAEEVDSMASCVIRSANAEECRKAMVEVCPTFFKLAFAMASIQDSVVVNPVESARLSEDSLETVAKFFKANGDSYLGTEANLEIDFAIRTMQRGFRRVPALLSSDPASGHEEKDRQIAAEYAGNMLFSNFQLKCLEVAISRQETIMADVLDELLTGVRECSLDAYACVREALDLRGVHADRYEGAQDAEWSWDEEDAELIGC